MGEGPPVPESEPIRISKEEWETYCNLQVNDPELIRWMSEKGLTFDSGPADVELNGQMGKMETSRADFGTFRGQEKDKE